MKQLIKFITICLLALLIPQMAFSFDFEIDGIYYAYDSNSQTVYVTYDKQKEQSYSGNVVIPNTVTYKGKVLYVTSIGEKAFYNCKNLESVSLPNSIKTIEFCSFSGCIKITSIVLPINIESIGSCAFSGCINLKSIDFPRALNIGSSAFQGCTSLTELRIPNGQAFIERYTFKDCTSLKYVFIPHSIKRICTGAFQDCTGIETLVFEDGENGLDYSDEMPNPFTGVHPKNLFIGRQSYNDIFPTSHYPLNYGNVKVLSIGKFIKDIYLASNSFETIYTFSEHPGKASFENSTYFNAILYVPTGTKDIYLMEEGWKNFFNIQEMDIAEMWNGDGEPKNNDNTKEKCKKPTICYSNGKLLFESATEGAICQSTITDSDITSYSGNEVELGITYHISVYATAEGYENSDVATATLCWIDVDPKTEGIKNSVSQVRARAILLQTNNGTLNISGAEDGTNIDIYTSSGMMIGSVKSSGKSTSIATGLRNGEVAIVKIGEKVVKVLMK